MPRKWNSAAARRLRALAGNSESTEEAVEIIVSRLLDGISTSPTDLDAIASKLEAEIEFDESLFGSGALEQSGRGYRILCSPHQPKVRQQFTVAHEIAHIVFEKTGPHCPRRGAELERLCDMISARLLIPEEVARSTVGRYPSLACLQKLARMCRVSVATTLIRATELWVDCAVGYVPDETSACRFVGNAARWMVRHAPSELDGLLKLVDGTLEGSARRVLETADGSNAFIVEWKCVGDAKSPIFLLRPANGIES